VHWTGFHGVVIATTHDARGDVGLSFLSQHISTFTQRLGHGPTVSLGLEASASCYRTGMLLAACDFLIQEDAEALPPGLDVHPAIVFALKRLLHFDTQDVEIILSNGGVFVPVGGFLNLVR